MSKWPRWITRRSTASGPEGVQVSVARAGGDAEQAPLDGAPKAIEALLLDLDPQLRALLAAIRGVADTLGYDEPIVAATHARRYADEVPSAEHRGEPIVLAFLNSAGATVRDGALVSAPVRPDGTRALVFHRTVRVRRKLKVMEAVVVFDGGTVRITGYGTPKTCSIAIFSFPSVQESVSDALAELREVSALEADRSEEQNGLRMSLFAEAMASLVGAHCGMTPDEAAQFSSTEEHAAISSLLADSRSLGGYAFGASDYATRCETDGWYEPSLRRSAIQFILDEYPAVKSILEAEISEDLDEMDETLRERASWVQPYFEAAVPAGIPDSHWWWRLPLSS